MGRILTPFSKRTELPRVPVEIADEVERFARDHDRHATTEFVPILRRGNRVAGTWVARFSLKKEDKRMKLFQEGFMEKAPTEDVWFHVRNPRSQEHGQPEMLCLDIYQMGPSGVRAFLERGNTWSGRGEFSSLVDQTRLAREANEQMKEKNRRDQKEASRYRAREQRRRRLRIPLLPVGIDLRGETKE
jgi:hypothetical protein